MKYFYTLLIVAVIFSFILYDDFASMKFQGSAFIGNLFAKLIPNDDLRQTVYELEKENESLRAEIFDSITVSPDKIKVYSSYPFNNRKDISIAGGENNGFKKGDAVTLNNKILVGQIKEVLKSSSVAKTIFDPEWEIAVRIGEKEIDGLLKGGLNPKIDFIKSDAKIKEGDIVITASPELPYGLQIGKIKTINEKAGAPFKKADVELEIQPNTLRDVSIYR